MGDGARARARVSRHRPRVNSETKRKELYNHLVISLDYGITYELVMIISCFLSSRFHIFELVLVYNVCMSQTKKKQIAGETLR